MLTVNSAGTPSGAEIELRSTPHARWRAAGQTAGVIYVCADEAGAARVRDIARERGMSTGRGGGLRIELLETIEREARAPGNPKAA